MEGQGVIAAAMVCNGRTRSAMARQQWLALERHGLVRRGEASKASSGMERRGEDRLGEDRLGEDRLGEDRLGEQSQQSKGQHGFGVACKAQPALHRRGVDRTGKQGRASNGKQWTGTQGLARARQQGNGRVRRGEACRASRGEVGPGRQSTGAARPGTQRKASKGTERQGLARPAPQSQQSKGMDWIGVQSTATPAEQQKPEQRRGTGFAQTIIQRKVSTVAKAPTKAVTTDGGAMIEIQPLKRGLLKARVIGTTPLLVHAWSEKAKKMMLDKQMKKTKAPKEAKNPEEDVTASRYISTDGWDGVPATGFKAAMVGACRQVDGLAMTVAKRMLFVKAQGFCKVSGMPLVKIEGKWEPHEAMVRLESGVADIRFRAIYKQWAANLEIEYNAGIISGDQIANLLSLAGYSEGICEYRPSAPKSCTGEMGRWELENGEALESGGK